MESEGKKTIRLIKGSGGTEEITGTPEEIAAEINKRYDKVIKFPPRGIYAHPSNPDWGKE